MSLPSSTTNDQYPRLDFLRQDIKWTSLDGTWDFLFDDEDLGRAEQWYKPESWPAKGSQQIQVPFVYQTQASTINEQKAHQIVWYRKHIKRSTGAANRSSTLLRFGAVDYEADVWLDGVYIGFHRGGHVPFTFDVSDVLRSSSADQASLVVRVWDAATDLTQPRGKQYWAAKPEGIFYTPSTGIWQSVWLETVPSVRVADSSSGTILKSNDIDSGNLQAEIAVIGRRKGQQFFVKITGLLKGVTVTESDLVEIDHEKDIARLSLNLRLSDEQLGQLPEAFMSGNPLDDASSWLNKLALWSPEHPILYDLVIELFDSSHNRVDAVQTYTGMRSVSWSHGDGTLRLNNRPYFHALVLDQGYWPSTNITPPTLTSCKEDILLAKSMGFNGCRKHQKVEDPSFLYWADQLGYLVWSEMANGYEFSRQYAHRFDQEWSEAVRRDINHPCVVAWTPINETWGYKALKESAAEQNHIRSLYYMTKILDDTRPINDNCGWEHVCTDLTTFHDYSDGPELARVCKSINDILGPKAGKDLFVGGASHQDGAPVICTEFGGVNIAPTDGETVVEGSWGYTTASDAKDLLERVRRLMLAVVEGGHCCGFVYTQLYV